MSFSRIDRGWFYFPLGLLFMALSLLSGCKSAKKVGEVTESTEIKTQKEFFTDIQKHAFLYQTLTARWNVNLDLPGNNLSSRVDLKMVKDSAFQLSVQPFLGIEIFRVEISLDSVKVLDRMNKRYVAENYANLKSQTPVEFNFYNLQALFTNQLFFPGQQEILPKQYNQFKLKQEGGKAELQVKDMMGLLYTFCVNSDSKVYSTSLSEPSGHYGLQWDYADFRQVKEQFFPMKMDIKWIKERVSQGKITIAFSRVETDVPVKMDFSIPSGYKRITLAQILKSLSNKK